MKTQLTHLRISEFAPVSQFSQREIVSAAPRAIVRVRLAVKLM